MITRVDAAIVEIKTPQTALLNTGSYRGGVFCPSTLVSGAINQTLDQKYKFEREIAQIKENSRLYDMESYSVHCSLIVGTMPTEEAKRKRLNCFVATRRM